MYLACTRAETTGEGAPGARGPHDRFAPPSPSPLAPLPPLAGGGRCGPWWAVPGGVGWGHGGWGHAHA